MSVLYHEIYVHTWPRMLTVVAPRRQLVSLVQWRFLVWHKLSRISVHDVVDACLLLLLIFLLLILTVVVAPSWEVVSSSATWLPAAATTAFTSLKVLVF